MSAPRVFVSHSHQDDAFTKRLVADLKAAGADVWVDVVGIDRGDFQERINAALGSCQFLVLVLTPDAIASQWVRMETHAAIGLKVQGQMQDILPVAAKSVDAHTIPPLWTNFHRFDATKDYPRALAELLRGLGLPTPRAEPLPTPPPPTPPSRQSEHVHAVNPDQTRAWQTPRRTRLVLALLVIVLLTGAGSLAVLNNAGQLFASQMAQQTPNISHVTPTSNPTPTAAQWQAVIDAVQNFCAKVEAQRYHDAFQLFSTEQQNTIGESHYLADMQWRDEDAYYGPLVLCKPDYDPKDDKILGGTVAIYTFQVQRRMQKSAVTGTISLVKEGNSWKIDTPQFGMDLL